MTTPAAVADRGALPAGPRGMSGPGEPAGAGGARAARRSRRDWTVDGLLFAAALLFVGLSLGDGIEQELPATLLTVDIVLGLLSSAGVWVRRRWPVGFAAVAGLFGVVSLSSGGPMLIGLFTVAVHRRFRVLVPLVAWFAVAAFVSVEIRPDMAPTHWSQQVIGLVLVTVFVASGVVVRAQRQSEREQARRADAERELLVAQARQHERDRIAREMHDVLAHRLSLLSLHAGALELRLGTASGQAPGEASDEVARAAGLVRDNAHGALQDLREVIGVLRAGRSIGAPDDDAPEKPQPTLAQLPDLVDESRQAGMLVLLETEVPDTAVVPAVIGRAAYRIVQEGLTNARKHASGGRVAVTVRGAPNDGLTVEIRNPCPAGTEGAGIPGAGAGIIGLTERATLAGGRLEHGRTGTGDFRLFAWLPWPS